MENLSSLKSQSWLSWFLRGLMLLGFSILIVRIIDLQIIRGDYFRGLAEGNRIRRISISAPRGKIFARGGEIIVDNKEIKKAVIYDENEGYKKSTKVEGYSPDELISEPFRDYKFGAASAHITGYVGEVNEEELGKIKADCPEKGPRKLGNFVGRTGLEEEYDCQLSGIDGEELVEVNAMGEKIRVFGRRPAIPGSNLHTTLDYGLQKKISELMQGKKGAVIATDASGEVLALYSSPSFDPNLFLEENSSSINKVLTDKNTPLFNRAIGGVFHPGSVYKPITAIAALEEGKIDENFKYTDEGQIVIETLYGTFSYKNWYFTQYGGTEGNIDLKRAIARSNDTFFYKIGELTGPENLFKWSEKFGLNKKTEIDLPGEIIGLVPSPEWKLKEKKERWFLGNTYHMAIGQGDLALTPVSLNSAISVIATNGKYCKPHLLKRDVSEDCREIDIARDNIDLVIEGMKEACTSGGTAYTFFDFKEKSGIDVACKTGTAQNEVGEPHAWFSAFDKKDTNSQLILTVLVENGGEGSKVAGPIAREIFNHFFNVATPTLTPTGYQQNN